ncbi:MAG TPA: carboxypeptidase-like regulatory domain-containing protein [Syntrophales bacterium]|nr:carboxypeptidase-like regulatory domain-containing protein [Syntrophales bacterium]
MQNMRIKNVLKTVFLLVIFLTIPSSAYCQGVRGMLFRVGPHGPYPAVNVHLTLISSSIGRSAPTYTGRDGMYYFYNVPPGQYALEVWGYGPNPIIHRISVLNRPYNDIPQIQVP